MAHHQCHLPRWFSNTGDVRMGNSDDNALETCGNCERWRTIVRGGSRAGTCVATQKSNP